MDENTEVLDQFEARVLAVLAEKEALTPDVYPLSLNALTAGCNQLSSRDPVMRLSGEAVYDVLQRLMQRRLVSGVQQAGARVPKYEHRMRAAWSLEQDKLAILTVLMLRGPQTAGEIRTRTGRLHDFKAVADVEAGLQFLIDKFPPLAARLPVSPGAKEPRYAHLLCGEQVVAQHGLVGAEVAVEPVRTDRVAELEAEVAGLREQVAALSAQFEEFRKQLA